MNQAIIVGLKFKSAHFSVNAEVLAVREDKNELDVLLTPGNGNAWVEKSWNLKHTKWAFEKGQYIEIPKQQQFHPSVW